MKKINFSVMLSASVLLWACNNAGEGSSNKTTDTSTSTTSTTNTMNDTSSSAGRMNTDTAGKGATTTATSSTPLAASDRKFVIEAAKGGMMEVEAGKIAQENASSQRVKDFGTMMVNDHSKANDQLKSLVSSKGLTIPEDSLMNKNKTHLDEMRKMKGQAFDNHYKMMMLGDHKKDVSEFKKAATTVKDADLKNWINTTLPTLQMHLDSAQAMNKSKM